MGASLRVSLYQTTNKGSLQTPSCMHGLGSRMKVKAQSALFMCCPSKQKPKSPSTFITEPFSNQYKVTKSRAERERERERENLKLTPNPKMVNYHLKITAELENLTNLQPQGGCDDPNFSYLFKVSFNFFVPFLRDFSLDYFFVVLLLIVQFLHCINSFTSNAQIIVTNMYPVGL